MCECAHVCSWQRQRRGQSPALTREAGRSEKRLQLSREEETAHSPAPRHNATPQTSLSTYLVIMSNTFVRLMCTRHCSKYFTHIYWFNLTTMNGEAAGRREKTEETGKERGGQTGLPPRLTGRKYVMQCLDYRGLRVRCRGWGCRGWLGPDSKAYRPSDRVRLSQGQRATTGHDQIERGQLKRTAVRGCCRAGEAGCMAYTGQGQETWVGSRGA